MLPLTTLSSTLGVGTRCYPESNHLMTKTWNQAAFHHQPCRFQLCIPSWITCLPTYASWMRRWRPEHSRYSWHEVAHKRKIVSCGHNRGRVCYHTRTNSFAKFCGVYFLNCRDLPSLLFAASHSCNVIAPIPIRRFAKLHK